MEKIKTPVLFVAGEHELEATKASNIYLAQKMKRAKAYLMPKVGHGWLVQHPAVHINMVKAWLNNQELPNPLIAHPE